MKQTKTFFDNENNFFIKFYTFNLIILTTIVSILHLKEIFWDTRIDNNLLENFFRSIKHFTSQSNLLITIVMLLLFTPLCHKKFFPILTFIALINILLTCILTHIFINTKEKYDLYDTIKKGKIPEIIHFKHTFIPILYFIFYFFKNNKGLNVKKTYLGIIHPLCYFFFFLLINSLRIIDYYPYEFINPSSKDIFQISNRQGYGFLFLTVVFLAFIFYFLSYIILFIKNKIK